MKNLSMIMLVILLAACQEPTTVAQLQTDDISAMRAFQHTCLSQPNQYIRIIDNKWTGMWELTCFKNPVPDGMEKSE